MEKIKPCLWFNGTAEDAMNFYLKTFKNGKIVSATRWGKGQAGQEGSLLVGTLELFGRQIVFLNGGPEFKLDEAFSLIVDCEDQKEVDEHWAALTADGGQESVCGWLKDKFGLSWQIVPKELPALISNPDPVKAKRALDAMLQMKKIDIQKIKDAAEGR